MIYLTTSNKYASMSEPKILVRWNDGWLLRSSGLYSIHNMEHIEADNVMEWLDEEL